MDGQGNGVNGSGAGVQSMPPDALIRRFPRNFVWGVSTSAYQIEGAASDDGRAESIWDHFCRQPGAILDGSDGHLACDHYHHLDTDLDIIARLGVPAYRFSIAWPRVQPLGRGQWNEKGFAFYERVIDGLLKRKIAPHITLYHWDLPQALQDEGGWVILDTVERFADYARKIMRRFGDRVQSIATINEPWVVATLGHEAGIFAPGIKSRRIAAQVSHHLLLGHGLALTAMRAESRTVPLGIVLNLSPVHVADDATEQVRAQARLEDGNLVRWYMDPLFKGQYPADVLEDLGADAPVIESGHMAAIAQPMDFLGVNYYTRRLIGTEPKALNPKVELTSMGWEVFPSGLTELLLRLNRDYRLPPVFITENGAAYDDQLDGDRVVDTARTHYLALHIAAVADAMDAGVDVRGYFTWSLLDNFEWAHGYSQRFGIVYVDYATQARTLKDSAVWYQQLLAARAGSSAGALR